MEIKIAGVVDDSIVDGPGIRLSVFTQGCSHRCPGCHNPQTHDPAGGQMADTDDIVAQASRNPLLKGVTLTGGEPFEQPEACLEIARGCHALGLDVWAYTGSLYEDIEAGVLGEAAVELLHECDVLVDGPFVEELKTLGIRFRGSSNQRVIDVKRSLDVGGPVDYEFEW